MKKCRFLFYRAKFEWRNFLRTRQIRLVDDLISWWTWPYNIGTGPYGHAEVWLPGDRGMFITHPLRAKKPNNIETYTKIHGTCYTSTLRDNYKGTCKRPASEILKHPERWDFAEVDIPKDLYYAMLAWMEIQVENNKGYDKKAILSFFWPKRFHNADKFICSEFAHHAAVMADILPYPLKVVSPRRLARMLTEAGHEIKRLK